MPDYSRQISLPEIGPEGQKRISRASVAVIGIGGLGCAALPYLAAAGVRRLGLFDFDRVDASNLHRQILFGLSDIGILKVEAAARRLSDLYPETQIEKYPFQFETERANHLLSYDLILDATDNKQARYAINDACKSLEKPWVYASLRGFEAQVSLFLPGKPDYRSLFPNAQNSYSCSDSGVLGPFVGAIGSIQAAEAIKWLAGMEETLAGKLLCLNGKNWRVNLLSFEPPKPNWEISLDQFHELQEKESIQLIDVREPAEKAEFDLGGELNPASCFKNELLDKEKTIVLYCRSGKRSGRLAEHLRSGGFKAFSLNHTI